MTVVRWFQRPVFMTGQGVVEVDVSSGILLARFREENN